MKNNYTRDPNYDDIQLAQISEMQLEELVDELVAYILFETAEKSV